SAIPRPASSARSTGAKRSAPITWSSAAVSRSVPLGPRPWTVSSYSARKCCRICDEDFPPPRTGGGGKLKHRAGLRRPVARHDVLADQIDLALDIVERHQALVALPYEPFRMRVFDQRVHPARDLVEASDIGEVRPLH